MATIKIKTRQGKQKVFFSGKHVTVEIGKMDKYARETCQAALHIDGNGRYYAQIAGGWRAVKRRPESQIWAVEG